MTSKMNEAASPFEHETQISELTARDNGTTVESGSIVYRGAKGSLHRKQENPRAKSKKNWKEEFANRYFEGDRNKAEASVARFRELDSDPTTAREASGMLATFIAMGCKEDLCRDVFGIGGGRYMRIRDMKGNLQTDSVSERTGRNNVAFGKEDEAHLARFVKSGVPVEEGYPCQHRRLKVYCTDPLMTSMEALFKTYYLPFEAADESIVGIRKMKKNSFFNYMKAYHPEFHLRRLVEDACDVCVELKTQLKSKDLSDADRHHIEQALANHGELARSLRNTMRDAIDHWKGRLSTDIDTGTQLDGAALRLVAITIDDDAPPAEWTEEDVGGIELACEDYAGNFTTPHYGGERPGADYYASKVALYTFIVADLSRNTNYVYTYDERGMGKDADALCSLRFVHHLRKVESYRSSNMQRPSALFQIMDNNVGQNKSQAVLMFFALLSMTWYPEGVSLLYLLPGHSHMACDRVVSWLRKKLKGDNLFLPEHFVQRFNAIPSVRAEFIDHRDTNRLMFRNFEPILKRHMVTIPPIPGGGYTRFYSFEFKRGVLTMRKAADSAVEFTHSYVQGLSGKDDDTTYDELLARCVASLAAHLFRYGKTFSNASVADIAIGGTDGGLVRHPGQQLTQTKVVSFWTKGFSIPREYLSYYPENPNIPEELSTEADTVASGNKRKSIQDASTKKLVAQNTNKRTLLARPSASFFKAIPPPAVPPIRKSTAKRLTWHTADEEDDEKAGDKAGNIADDMVDDKADVEADVEADDTVEIAAGVDEEKPMGMEVVVDGGGRDAGVFVGPGAGAGAGEGVGVGAGVGVGVGAGVDVDAGAITRLPRRMWRGATQIPVKFCRALFDNVGIVAHFPWADNKCGTDSSLCAFYLTYLKAHPSDVATLRSQFAPVTDILDLYISGEIDSVEAKQRLIALFQIEDERWVRNDYVPTDLSLTYLKETLCAPGPDGTHAFNWVYQLSWQCGVCNAVELDEKLHTNCEIALLVRSVKSSMAESINVVQNESVRKSTCRKCHKQKRVRRVTKIHPMILHFSYPTHAANGCLDLPPHLERHVMLDDVHYDLVGATYGDGTHFVFRYYLNGKVFECDGAHRDASGVQVAISVEIDEPYEDALAGHLMGRKRTSYDTVRRGKKIVDVFYYKRNPLV